MNQERLARLTPWLFVLLGTGLGYLCLTTSNELSRALTGLGMGVFMYLGGMFQGMIVAIDEQLKEEGCWDGH